MDSESAQRIANNARDLQEGGLWKWFCGTLKERQEKIKEELTQEEMPEKQTERLRGEYRVLSEVMARPAQLQQGAEGMLEEMRRDGRED